MSGLSIVLPPDLLRSLRIPESEVEAEVLKELGLALYARGALTAGKARELSRLSPWQFRQAVARRGIDARRTEADLEEDLAYGRGDR